MTNNEVYVQCNELLKLINLQEIMDDTFVKIVKADLVDIKSEPEDSYKTARKVLFTALSSLRNKFKPTKAFDVTISKIAS